MRLIKLFLILFLPSLVLAQSPIYEKVQQSRATQPVSQFNLVETAAASFMTEDIQTEVSDGLLLNINTQAIQDLKADQPNAMRLSLPLPDNSEIQLELIENKVLTDDFILRLSSDPENYTKYNAGSYYHGYINGDPNSVAAISIFDDEIRGTIMTDDGNFVLGKVENSTKHIIYNDKDLNIPLGLDCGMEDDGVAYHPSELEYSGERSPGDCIRIYIEIDNDIVSQKGGVTNATNYITGLFNESFTLYANDGLTLVISEIKAWDTNSPYSSSSSTGMLNDFQASTGVFNGDLAHLVSYQASGGVAAGFSGICNSNPDNSKCFSSIGSSYNNVPTYSYSVMVVTHEMGHLIGSRHTHACVWNGNGTAIDGCAGFTEGSCSIPGSPSAGGTIMSYCHIATGIDFTQGFGPQPKAVIQNTVNNASCLSNCGTGGPTCTDGIQNGDETGVDCGGSSCPACPTACNDNEVTITINLDNYPEETSWSVVNASGSTVASGGTYGSQPDGSTITETVCLVDGCYDFIINDAYGDGICCGYGNGSYAVTAGGSTLASGGQFTSSESTNFCLGGSQPVLGCTDPTAHNYDSAATQDDGSCETCSDGTQNGDETGTDCGGSLCAPCNNPGGNVTLLGSFFETGWDGWSDGGSDCYRYRGSRSYEGNYSIRIRDNSNAASAMTSGAYDVSAYSQITIDFYFYAYSMENGEDFWVRYYDGSSWNTVAAYARGTSFNNNTFYTASVTINSSSYNFPSNAQFRFQCDASSNADHIYIDQVTITASSGALIESSDPIVTIDELDRPVSESANAISLFDDSDVAVFPNPANDVLNINTNAMINSMKVVSVSGQLMRIVQPEDGYSTLNISDLQSGMYYLIIETPDEMITEKFVKL